MEMTKERFLILGQQSSGATRKLREVLAPLGRTEVIVNHATNLDDGDFWYPDALVSSYGGLMSGPAASSGITAWSRAMYHLEQDLEDEEGIWFVEDDVAGNHGFFSAFVRETAAYGADFAAIDIFPKEIDPQWEHWNTADPWFKRPWRSFKPLCRKSPRLIRAALAFRKRHGRFAFHEVLFPSLANEGGMLCLDWRRISRFRQLTPVMRVRPTLRRMVPGICHPVVDPEFHEAICSSDCSPPDQIQHPELPSMPRIRKAGFEPWSIQAEEYAWTVRHCRRHGILTAVEIGCGTSTHALLDAGCRVLSLESDPRWLAHVAAKLSGEPGLEFRQTLGPEGGVTGELPFKPDLVVINGEARNLPGAPGLREIFGFGSTIADQLLVHGSHGPIVESLLQILDASGHQVSRIPSARGMAWIRIVRDSSAIPAPPDPLSHYRLEAGGWHQTEAALWELWLATDHPMRVLEIGAGDGGSANLMLDLLFPNPESEVHCIGLYEPNAESPDRVEQQHQDFVANATAGAHLMQIHLYEGHPTEVLAWMIAAEDYWESFDLVHLADGKSSTDMLSAACQSWHLLKPGGVLIFGRQGTSPVSPAIIARKAFRSAFEKQMELVFEGSSAAFRKLPTR